MSVQDLVTSAANRYGVDPTLALSVAKAESALDPNALSHAGAVGVMQLMPSSFPGVNIYDPQTNVDAGVGYLSQLLNKYNGDTSLALAAYNAGPGNVQKYGGIPPFTETQNYVQKVLGWMRLSGNGGDGTSDSGVNTAYDSGNGGVVNVDGQDTLVMVAVGVVATILAMELL